MDSLRAGARIVLFIAGAVAAGAALLVVLNLAQGWWGLHRLREPLLIAEGCLLLAVLVGPEPRARALALRDAAARALDHPGFFPASAVVLLAVYLDAVAARHLAFLTSSHDFGMIEDAVWWSHHGRLLYSPVIGRSFLSEHFSPILLALVPLHALVPTPWLLLVAQAAVLWGGGVALRGIVLQAGHPRVTANLAFVLYLNHPSVVSTLQYVVHMEAALPLILFLGVLADRAGRRPLAALALAAALLVKEDVGIYVAGYGAWIALRDGRRRDGILVAVAGLGWTALATGVLIPRFAGGGEGFRFLGRWGRWGDTPAAVLLGFALHPLDVLRAMVTARALRIFACLLFLPFLSRWGWVPVVAPWLLNATSGEGQQAGFSLYYGLPVAALAALAAVDGLRAPFFRRVTRGAAGAIAVGCAAVLPNVAHFTFPEADRHRGEILEGLRAIPPDATVEILPCFWPVLPHEQPKRIVRDLFHPGADWVVLRTHTSTWPFAAGDVAAAVDSLRAGGAWAERLDAGGTHVFERVRGR